MYLEKAKQIFFSFREKPPAPCTQEQVEQVEQFLHLKLPQAFREYLLWMGRGVTDMMDGSDFFYLALFDLREGAETLMAHTECQETLPQDAIVFFMHGGNRFMFIRASEGDDPPVYYSEGGPNGFIKTGSTFSTYLEKKIKEWGLFLQEKKLWEEEARLQKNKPL